MIIKKQYNNKTAIQKDKENFIKIALNKGFLLEDVLNFMEHYENLKSFKENLKNIKGVLKDNYL